MIFSVFESGIKKIYAAHGKSAPTGDILMAIFGRVVKFPDAFMPYAADYVCDVEKLPSNMGRFLAHEVYQEYLRTNPLAAVSVKSCPRCDPLVPGFFYASSGTGGWVLLRCMCNRVNTGITQFSHDDARYIGLEPFRWSDKLKRESTGKSKGLKLVDPSEKNEDRFVSMTDAERADCGLL